MTCSYFDQLSEASQTDMIFESGAFVGRRTAGFHTVLLFQIEGFYTEIYYHSHFNVIIRIESFSDMERLEPYLDSIELASLFSSL